MTVLEPLQTLYEPERAATPGLPLPPRLADLYGGLSFPPHASRPWVIGNFVSSLDGVVSLGVPGKAGGDQISGFNPHDQMLMGLLRAAADAVIIGAGTLRAATNHLWTADYIFPDLAPEYQALRDALGKSGPPLNVIVSASGKIDLGQRVFQSGEVDALIVATAQAAKRLRKIKLPGRVRIEAVAGAKQISSSDILDAVGRQRQGDLFLVEGGPQLLGNLLASHCLDELFLTVAPQVAGRDASLERPGFVAGNLFAPDHPLWGTLAGVRRGGSHLFLRYAFNHAA